jgi:hypothetical protein
MMTVRASASEGPGETDRDGDCGADARIDQFIADVKEPTNPHPPAFATLKDGYRANCIVGAMLESAKKGRVWTKDSYWKHGLLPTIPSR